MQRIKIQRIMLLTIVFLLLSAFIIPVNAGEIHKAARAGDLAKIKLLLEKEPGLVNEKTGTGNTPLFFAVFGGHSEVVDFLISKGAEVSDKNNAGENVLHYAAYSGSVKLLKFFLDKGLDINSADIFGEIPLHKAAAANKLPAVKLMIENNADINAGNSGGKTPYQLASTPEHKELTEYLIAKGADREPDKFPVLNEAYLGQKRPGLEPELFAPGIISTPRAHEMDPAFYPGLKEFYYCVSSIYFSMKREGKRWSEPDTALFSGKYPDYEVFFTHDGKQMYFISLRPPENWEIWYADRTGSVWGKVKLLGEPFKAGFYPTVSKNGNIYFTGFWASGKPPGIYRSLLKNGEYSKPEKLSKQINFPAGSFEACIAPDESYIIFASGDSTTGYGNNDLYISFRGKDGLWSKARNFGPDVNTAGNDSRPVLSPDGKYFFFSSDRYGTNDIFWADIEIIQHLKNNRQKSNNEIKIP